MLYLIGLGLHDEEDISLKALKHLKKADKIYAEFYTTPYRGKISAIESLTGKKIIALRRRDIEEKPQENVLKDALREETVLLVGGDPMVATTHTDLLLRAKKMNIETKVIHASSVYSAAAETGLQIYKFGKTASIPYPEKNYSPASPHNILEENLSIGAHTLFLLDTRQEENKHMTINEAIEILLEINKKKNSRAFTEETFCVGAARLGGDTKIKAGKAKELLKEDFGQTPHILIVPAKLHYMEEEFLETFSNQ